MDERLERRYQILFENYHRFPIAFPGFTPEWLDALEFTKQEIISQSEKRGILLRSDALLFLFSNLDQMIIRPYSGHIPLPDAPGPKFDAEKLNSAIAESINIILEGLVGQEPYSSHAVMTSIQEGWAKLSEILLWG